MGSLYGHKWTSGYGDEPDPDGVWAATLMDVPWEKIMHGFNQVTKKGGEWPPAAPEFKKMCLGEDEHWAHKVHAATVKRQQGQRQIEQKRDPEEIAKNAQIIRDLRKGLI